MKVKYKSNKLILVFLIILCFIFVFNAKTYSKSCLDAISVWSVSVLPVLLPVFIITKIIINLTEIKQNKLDKFFLKAYNTPTGSASVFFLSLISGYPVGAKLIGEMYENKYFTTDDAKKLLSFCSICGPAFVIGTVGGVFLNSILAGVLIFIANLMASLVNGFIFRGRPKKIENKIIFLDKKENILEASVYNSLISILMVGCYIVISFILIDILQNFNIIPFLSNTICGVFNLKNSQQVVNSILCGIIEMTRGLLYLSSANIGLNLKIIISSGLIGFGGFSVFLQSFSFISKLKIKARFILLQKLIQGVLSCIFAFLLTLIFV